jgi:hypothetical protein
MTHPPRRTGRIPKDVQARERLREAQDAEARAVSAACAAQEALAAAIGRRDTAVAAANALLAEAEQAVASAQASVVAVSGVERASVLLGVSRTVLRKARATVESATGRDDT